MTIRYLLAVFAYFFLFIALQGAAALLLELSNQLSQLQNSTVILLTAAGSALVVRFLFFRGPHIAQVTAGLRPNRGSSFPLVISALSVVLVSNVVSSHGLDYYVVAFFGAVAEEYAFRASVVDLLRSGQRKPSMFIVVAACLLSSSVFVGAHEYSTAAVLIDRLTFAVVAFLLIWSGKKLLAVSIWHFSSNVIAGAVLARGNSVGESPSHSVHIFLVIDAVLLCAVILTFIISNGRGRIPSPQVFRITTRI